jgi:hypothetical protein
VKFLIKNFPGEIKLIIESDTIIPGKSKIAGLLKYIKISGFHYTFSQILKQLAFVSFFSLAKDSDSIRYPYEKLTRKSGIDVENWEKLWREGNLINKIKQQKPDLIISTFFRYLIKKDILEIPIKAALNIHPSLLPFYKGVSPTFWVLANNERKTGVTVHIMDETQKVGLTPL